MSNVEQMDMQTAKIKTHSLDGKVEYTSANVVALVIETGCYQTVADIFGLSRERVRQIAKAADLPPMREVKAARNEKLLKAAATHTLDQLATEFKMKPLTVNAILRKAGVEPLANTGDDSESSQEQMIHEAVKEIADTRASIRSVSKKYNLSPETVRRYCKKANVVSTHGRWHKNAKGATA